MASLRVPTDLLHRISLSSLHALFAAHGYPPGVTPSTRSLDAIARGLASPSLPSRLAAALRTLRTLAPDPGPDAVVDALADRGFALSAVPTGETHLDRVARLLADDPRDKRRVLARALVHVRHGATSLYRLYRGRRERRDPAFDAHTLARFEALVRAWLASRGYAPYVRVLLRDDPAARASIVLEIVRGC